MNQVRATRLVARREIAERLRGRAIWVITAITTVVVVALIMIPAAVRQAAGPTSVGLAGPSAQALRPALERGAAAARISARFTDLASAAAARAAVRDGSVAVALSVGDSAAVALVKQARRTSGPWCRRSSIGHGCTRCSPRRGCRPPR